MLKYNGGVGTIGYKNINIQKIEDIIENNNGYNVKGIFPNLVYFGSDGSGDAYAFDKNSNLTIIKVPFITDDVDGDKEKIGTFEELLESLVKPNMLDVLRKESNIEIKHSSKQESMRKNDVYNIPNGGDIIIYLNYECCKNKITESGVNAFFANKLKVLDSVIVLEKPHVRLSISGICSKVAEEKFEKLADDFKIEFMKSLREDGESKQVIEMFNKCDSEYLFDTISKNDAFAVYCFALYLSNFEESNVLLYDTYSGNILNKDKIEKVVFEYKNQMMLEESPKENSNKNENKSALKKKLSKILLLGILSEIVLFVLIGTSNNKSMTTFLALLFSLILAGEFITFIYYILVCLNVIKPSKKSNFKQVGESIAKKEKPIVKTYIVEFPYYGVREIETGDEYDAKCFNGIEAYKWFSEEVVEGIKSSWNNSNMVDFIDDKHLKSKINDMRLNINSNGTCHIFVETYEFLNDEEKKYILDFIKGQASDGWGEGDFDFIDNNNQAYSVRFWSRPHEWYIRYVEDSLFNSFIDKYMKETEKECYEVKLLNSSTSLTDNKIGGDPYLPLNEEYPLDSSGRPMFLLLQVNLKDIELDNYPRNGILEIFTGTPAASNFEFTIKHFDEDLECQKTFPIKPELLEYGIDSYFVSDSYKINLERTKAYMPYTDFRFLNLIKELTKEIYNVYIESFDEIEKIWGEELTDDFLQKISSNNITIGGYADFNQGDPRDYSNEDKTECIFKLDSQACPDKIYIGDNGVLFALISENELKNGHFEKAFVDYDCM